MQDEDIYQQSVETNQNESVFVFKRGRALLKPARPHQVLDVTWGDNLKRLTWPNVPAKTNFFMPKTLVYLLLRQWPRYPCGKRICLHYTLKNTNFFVQIQRSFSQRNHFCFPREPNSGQLLKYLLYLCANYIKSKAL